MNKILLALAILGVGTAGFVTARQSTNKLQREASAIHESWIVQTQVLVDAQSDLAQLTERFRALKQNLRQAETAGNQNSLWSVLATNRTGDLPPDLRERLLEELGFTWNSSEAFIVVSKETVRDIRMHTIGNYPPWKGKLTDSAAAVLALTPQERSQIEAAMEGVKTDYKDWAISHTERSEPRDDVLAQYTVQGFSATNITTITNNFFTELSNAIGKQRTELIMPYAGVWIEELGISDKPTTMILKRSSDGTKQVLKAQVFTSFGTKLQSGAAEPWDISKRAFPKAFLPLFPNGWADVAEREGFEIPTEPQKQ